MIKRVYPYKSHSFIFELIHEDEIIARRLVALNSDIVSRMDLEIIIKDEPCMVTQDLRDAQLRFLDTFKVEEPMIDKIKEMNPNISIESLPCSTNYENYGKPHFINIFANGLYVYTIQDLGMKGFDKIWIPDNIIEGVQRRLTETLGKEYIKKNPSLEVVYEVDTNTILEVTDDKKLAKDMVKNSKDELGIITMGTYNDSEFLSVVYQFIFKRKLK